MAQSPPATILLTGSSGLIGTRLQQALAADYHVVGLDKVAPARELPNTEFVETDLTSDESVKAVLDGVRGRHGSRLASCVHLAAYYDFSGEPSPMYERLTVEGTRRLIRALDTFEVEQFIFSSSLLVMQPVEAGEPALTEASPTRAEWDYPRSKLEAEQVLHDERGRIPVVVLRIAGVYDERGHSLPIGQHIRRIYEKQLESYFFPGNTEHGQPFIHLDDLTACVTRTIERRRELDPWEVFLIAEPEVLSYETLQETLGLLIHGKEWPTIRIPKTAARAGAWLKEKVPGAGESFIKPWMVNLADQHYPVRVTRASERLGWSPVHRLRDALAPMVDRLKRDPRGWYQEHKFPLPADLQEAR